MNYLFAREKGLIWKFCDELKNFLLHKKSEGERAGHLCLESVFVTETVNRISFTTWSKGTSLELYISENELAKSRSWFIK